MKVLITGGSGYIGSNLVPLFKKAIVLDLRKPGYKAEVTYVQGDVARVDSALEGFEDEVALVDAVVHMAAITGKLECYSDKHKAYETNVAGTERVLEFCRKNDVNQMVFTSTCGIYCDTGESCYIETKKRAEEYCREYSENYGINTVILRIANVYGGAWGYKKKATVVHKFVLQALMGQPLTVEGDGSQSRDFIHVCDVCNGIKGALQLDVSGTFFLGTGVETTINRLVEIVEKAMRTMYNRQIDVEYVPMPTYRVGEGVKAEITNPALKAWEPTYTIEKGITDVLGPFAGNNLIAALGN